MARDSQLAGDRVQTEYYLQYADHYFRMLGETRARFEEQRPRRGEDMDEDEGDGELAEAGEAEASDRDERQDREPRPPRRDREPRRFNRDERSANEGDGGERPERRPRLNGADDSLPLDVLPPAIGADDVGTLTSEETPAPRPRRRARGARPAEGEDEVAPAA